MASRASQHQAHHQIYNPKQFYVVVCPYCGAGVGRACFQLSVFKRRGERLYIMPHLARVTKARAGMFLTEKAT